MAFLSNLAVLLLLVCISHHLAVSRSPGRRGRGLDGDRGQHRGRSGVKAGRQPKSVPVQATKGRLQTRASGECSWTVAGEDTAVLALTCRKGQSSFSCEYEARPAACPQYLSNARLYWKQIARSLKKQKSLCRDSETLIRTGLCRGASRDAHFKLRGQLKKSARPHAAASPPTAVKSCQSDNRKLAEEYCQDAWSGLCTFFFTMVKDDDC